MNLENHFFHFYFSKNDFSFTIEFVHQTFPGDTKHSYAGKGVSEF